MPILPNSVLATLSTDQLLFYEWGHAIQSGEVPNSLAGRVIGTLNHSRWLTRGIRTLARYARTKNPTKKFQRIVFFVLNLYAPCWIKIKSQPSFQDGARHLQSILELSRDLCAADQDIVQKVMQDNGHFAHPENVSGACLSDPDEDIRRKGVKYILQARNEFNKEEDVRKSIPPEVNIHSDKFCNLVDLESVTKTEPPVTKELSEETILLALAAPLVLPPYPNDTQGVECMVRVVRECCSRRVGYHGRQRLILQVLKSRKRVKAFNTKKDDMVFD